MNAWLLMRLLLDECVPARLKRALPAHHVSTVPQEGWSGLKNGELLARAAQRFDVLITVDKNLPYQQNSADLPIAVFVLDARSIELHYLLPLMPALESALAACLPGSYVVVRAETWPRDGLRLARSFALLAASHIPRSHRLATLRPC